ncbi:MAG: hypothetical protein AABY00_04205 [Nanoarchaeota archaeon]
MLGLRKIGEGRYREVYSDGTHCYKVLKPVVRKQYTDEVNVIMHVDYPAQLYTALKFGIWDFNAHELSIYQKMKKVVPEEHMNFIAPLERIETVNDMSALVSKLIRDENGQVSPTLAEYGRIQDAEFWDSLNAAYFEFEEQGFPLFNLNDTNIVIQTTAKGIRPVIIDIKRTGLQTFPFQPWLFFREQRLRKTLRAWHKVFERYGDT